MVLENLLRSAGVGLRRLWRNPLSFTLTISVIAITLALPAAFYVGAANLRQLGGNLPAVDQISVFLQPDVEEDAARAILDRYRNDPRFDTVTLIGREQALREFREFSGFGESLDALGYNPLPVVLLFRPSPAIESEPSMLAEELRALPNVDHVQSDLQWAKRLRAMLGVAERIGQVLYGVLGLFVLLVVGNTIRLELQQRVEEISVKKMVGATDLFVLRPFVCGGFWYGFLGSLGGVVMVDALLLCLREPLNELSALYGGHYRLVYLGPREAVLMIAAASMLGMIGALVVTLFHLFRFDPD